MLKEFYNFGFEVKISLLSKNLSHISISSNTMYIFATFLLPDLTYFPSFLV